MLMPNERDCLLALNPIMIVVIPAISFSEPSHVVVVMLVLGLSTVNVPLELIWLKNVDEIDVIEHPVSTKHFVLPK
jgi:hypothetical protein